MKQTEGYLKKIEYFKNKNFTYQLDSLTGILQRGIVLEYIEDLINSKKKFTIVLIDIDNFKHINDTYGHLYGDEVLIRVTREITRNVAALNGVVGRLGGDEFLIVLEDVTDYDVIWKTCRALSLSAAAISYFFDGRSDISVTVTMGIARFPMNADNYEALFNCADKALYRGKHKGRNCFIIYKPDMHANIDLKNIKSNYSTTNLFKIIFDFLTSENRKLEFKILDLFEFLCQYMDLDSICLNTKEGIRYHVGNEKFKNFGYISVDEYEKLKNQENMIIMNHRNNFEEVSPTLFPIIMSQDIRSFIAVECNCGYSSFGYLRIDMNRERSWSKEEKDILLVVARTIAILKAKGE